MAESVPTQVSAAAKRPEFPAAHRWPVRLEFDGVILAPLRRRDAREWNDVRLANAAWLDPWEPTPPDGITRPRSAYTMIAGNIREARAGRLVPWAVRDGWTGGRPLIGGLSISGIAWGSALTGSIGYWIAEPWAGRGITPVAVALATDYAMKVMGLHRIEIGIRPENAASLRVVEKLGFRPEGTRPRFIHIAGDWRDHLIFALDSSETGPGLIDRVIGGRR